MQEPHKRLKSPLCEPLFWEFCEMKLIVVVDGAFFDGQFENFAVKGMYCLVK